RMPVEQVRAEIEKGHRAITEVSGRAPVGFRAPGYNCNKTLLKILSEYGYHYDSSPLPSWPYLVLKYAVLLWLAVRGKKSRSIWGNPFMGFGRRLPHVRSGMLVLPITVSPLLRLPLIGTAFTTAPDWLYRHMVRVLQKLLFVNLEFHAIDLMDMETDSLPQALAVQKDLQLPLEYKKRRIEDLLIRLCDTHKPLTLEAATDFFASRGESQ
ncbi:MAG: polysaccharide deacetylase family protein, partial [Candidatus Thorarchaeota archaeon]